MLNKNIIIRNVSADKTLVISGKDGLVVTLTKDTSRTLDYGSVQLDVEFLNNLYTYKVRGYLSVNLDGVNLSADQIYALRYTCGVSELDEGTTYADVTYYVDGALGSDVIGMGTSSSPYRTITAAYSRIPQNIDNTAKIVIAAGTYTDFPYEIANKCSKEGQLVFEGVLRNTLATEFTVDSFDFGGSDGYVYGVINVPTATWTVDAFVGKFIKLSSGANTGQTFGIVSNTATAITICSFWYDIASTDKFFIVEPAVEITISHNVGIDVQSTQTGQELFHTKSYLGMYGVKISMVDDPPTYYSVNFTNTSAVLFCSMFGYVTLKNSQINYVAMLDPAKAFVDTISQDPYSSFFSVSSCRMGLSILSNCSCAGEIFMYYGWNRVVAIAAKSVWSRTTDMEVWYTYLNAVPSSGQYPVTIHGGNHTLNLVHIEGSAYLSGMRIKDCACVDLSDITCNSPSIVGPGATIGHECRISAHNVTLSGASGALKFDNSATAVSWPGAGVRVADTLGSSSVTGY
jgi:hypothetical protein